MDSIIYYFQSTMLIERLVGVGIYAITLGYFFNKIQHARSSQAITRYLNHYLIVLCIMAFFYIPGQAADLYRWRRLSEPWMNESLLQFLSHRFISSTTPIGILLIYLCQKTGINGLLPMVCAFGFFSNAFHIIKSESMRENRSPDSIAVYLLFSMSSGRFLEVISGVRCMLAFSIVFRFIYDEIYENRTMLRSVPFYGIAALIHTSAIPLIVIRLICSLFEKKRTVFNSLLNSAIAVGTFIVGIRIGGDYIDAMFTKANSYITSNSYSYRWEYIIVILSMSVVVATIWNLKKNNPKGFNEEKSIIRFLLILLIGEIATITTYSFFHRFAAVTIFLSAPVILTYLNVENENKRWKSRKRIVAISLIVLLLACVRGNLCGYKFFLLT